MTQPSSSQLDTLQPGSVLSDLPDSIGNYKIVRKLGEGGFAMVYLAHPATEASRLVALKALNAPENYARFQREIETVAKLDHPNIIRIFDTGATGKVVPAVTGTAPEISGASQDQSGPLARLWSRFTRRDPTTAPSTNGRALSTDQMETWVPYFTMEYIAGGTLRDRLETGLALPRAEAMNLVRQLGSALTYAHQQDILHRDVNPNNILLDTGQTPTRPVLTDFGLVKPLSAEDKLTVTLGLVGTFHYYAPEQWLRADLTPATDLYALALTFFEMLAGQRAFRGDIFALRDKHLNEPLPSLSQTAPQVGPFFDEVLHKATAKNPEDRYETITEFIEALEAANTEADRHEQYREIKALIEQQAFSKALQRLEHNFIQPGHYTYRDTAKLFWGMVYASQHDGALPPEWDNPLDLRTRPLPEPAHQPVGPANTAPSSSEKWHLVNKYFIPVFLGLALLIGSFLAPQMPPGLKTPAVQMSSLILLVICLFYYTWVYYLAPRRPR